MDWPQIETWLKSSLWGILILGAIGSIGGVAVLWLLGTVFRRWLPAGLRRMTATREEKRLAKKRLRQALVLSTDPRALSIYAIREGTRAVTALMIGFYAIGELTNKEQPVGMRIFVAALAYYFAFTFGDHLTNLNFAWGEVNPVERQGAPEETPTGSASP